jgi:hypothetical protein
VQTKKTEVADFQEHGNNRKEPEEAAQEFTLNPKKQYCSDEFK